MRPDITKSRKVGGRHNEAAHVATAGGLNARRQCHRGVSGLFVTQKRLFFVDGRMIWPDLSTTDEPIPRTICALGSWQTCGRGTRRQAAVTTMDHADIRGLATAFHLSVAGLPQSSVGVHRMDARLSCSRIPLIGPVRRVPPPRV
jgi:hypothetical protein